LTGWSCQPHAQSPTWRARVWIITSDLPGMGGPTSSCATAGIAHSISTASSKMKVNKKRFSVKLQFNKSIMQCLYSYSCFSLSLLTKFRYFGMTVNIKIAFMKKLRADYIWRTLAIMQFRIFLLVAF
jgi:hypothetical protein